MIKTTCEKIPYINDVNRTAVKSSIPIFISRDAGKRKLRVDGYNADPQPPDQASVDSPAAWAAAKSAYAPSSGPRIEADWEIVSSNMTLVAPRSATTRYALL